MLIVWFIHLFSSGMNETDLNTWASFTKMHINRVYFGLVWHHILASSPKQFADWASSSNDRLLGVILCQISWNSWSFTAWLTPERQSNEHLENVCPYNDWPVQLCNRNYYFAIWVDVNCEYCDVYSWLIWCPYVVLNYFKAFAYVKISSYYSKQPKVWLVFLFIKMFSLKITLKLVFTVGDARRKM